MRQNENLKIGWIVARKVAVHVQFNKKNTGKILGLDLLKYTFLFFLDSKISVTNESSEVQRGEFLSYSEF